MRGLDRVSVEVARERAARAAEALAEDERVRAVFLFGSAADPDATSVGDVDLAIWSEPALSTGDLLRLRADVVLAVGGSVDLVSLNRASVVLAREVTRGECLYAADDAFEVELVTRAQARYWDFKPFLEEQWRLIAARQEARRRGSET